MHSALPSAFAHPALELAAMHLREPSSTWGLGTFGALAEFERETDEPCQLGQLRAATARGAIKITPDREIRAFAYEMLSSRPGHWHHGVFLCVRSTANSARARQVITELGPDRGAIRASEREAILFDLGLGASTFEFCVRTRAPALVARLRRASGSGLFDEGNELAQVLVEASPTRVAISPAARIEVYQRIPSHDGLTPRGPHTHLIPRILRPALTHPRNIAVPTGWVPALALYPAHALRDAIGEPKLFDHAAHAAFQSLLSRFGDPDAYAAKAMFIEAVARGDAAVSANGRFCRQACRVALRQLLQSGTSLPVLQDRERLEL